MLIYCRLVASGVGNASLIILAFASPAMALISSNEASFMRFTLLNSFSKAVFVFSPIPLIVSNADATWRLLRLSRWKVMAKRCTSSCICSSNLKRGECCFNPMVCGGKPNKSSEVRCFLSLARPAMGMVRCYSSITCLTASICPFPPSVMIRSGRVLSSSMAR